MIGIALFLVVASSTTGSNPTLERPEREDTIYVLEGDLARLEAFAANVEGWEGGELIEKDVNDRSFSYWAYSERSASQARQFLMSAAFSGLKLEILAYDQAQAFPKLRKVADEIATECGVPVDPFFIAPTGRVQFRPSPKTPLDQTACLLKGAKASEDINTKLDLIGNGRVAGQDTT